MKKTCVRSGELTSAQEFVEYAVDIGAVGFDGHMLESGRVSPYFFDLGAFSTGKTMSNLTRAYVAMISRLFKPDVVFGSMYHGIPIAATVAQAIRGDIGYAFNCENGSIIGTNIKGKNVLIVDGAITSSSARTVSAVRMNGGIPIGCIVAFDRQERTYGGIMSEIQEFQKKFGIITLAAATLDDLISFMKRLYEGGDDGTGRILNKVLAYRGQYGVI